VRIATPASLASPPARGSFPEIAGLSPEVTSAADHYVVDVNLVRPSVEATTWSLAVNGEVRRPLELSFDELQERFEVVEQYSVLSCISNEVGGPLVGHSAWRGVRLKDVLEEAGVGESAVDVVFTAADGYTDSITIETAMDPVVLLAVAQNGEPLTRDHGFPCRVRVPALYGMKNVKWLQSIEVVDRDYKGYWMKRGWSDVAVVRTQSRIDVAGSERSASTGVATWIAGVAWAGDRGIERVEVSTDGGDSWLEAQLREPIEGNLSWRQWAYRWTPGRAGAANVLCRATDGDGEVQTQEAAAPHPAGATGYHSVEVTVT
jgi:DMSO/TMAO reductase YedYZ molybdopterin-dependent catalytic subunit